jgi:hypothetical protein
MPMRMGPLMGGAFGALGLVLSIFAGLLANNPVDAILLRSMMWAGICYVVGYAVGVMAGQVSKEYAAKLASTVAEQDAAAESARAREAAEAAENAAVENAARAAAVPGK